MGMDLKHVEDREICYSFQFHIYLSQRMEAYCLLSSVVEASYKSSSENIFITVDIDWASDEVLDYTISYLEKEAISATFFVTHETSLLRKLRNNPLFELALHPNFQKLLDGTSEQKTAKEVFDQCKAIVPEAVSLRSHSLVESSLLFEVFRRGGIKFDVNLFIPWNAKMRLVPFYAWNGLVRVPYCFEDDLHCRMLEKGQCKEWDVSVLLKGKGMKVFNFHPIHLFLNTENLNRYEQAKTASKEMRTLGDFRFQSEEAGSFAILKKIVCGAKEQKMIFSQIKAIGSRY